MNANDETSDPADGNCPLSDAEQRRNMVLFACCTGLQYLAAPVLYIGITQASLCERLGANAKVSNLPATFYFAMTATPALIAWLFPYAAWLKRNLFACYAATGTMLTVMAVVLALPTSDEVRIAAVILQGAISGMAMPAAIAFLWEAIGRGTDSKRRGLALSLAFGAGPLLAVAGSLGSQLLLSGKLGSLELAGLEYPRNFIWLFGAGVPVMACAAFLSTQFIVPQPAVEAVREPLSRFVDLCAGMAAVLAALALYYFKVTILLPESIAAPFVADPAAIPFAAGHVLLAAAGLLFVHHFRDILSQRTLLIATIVTVLIYSGNTIPSNMNLYTKIALDDLPENYAGYQNALRFSFKVVAGFLLGWMLTKTNPRAGILVTGGIFVAAQLWAIFATGTMYLIAFGIYGAGELVGVYAPNYILSASRPAQIRRNMAFVTMLMAPAAPTGYLFGAISDYVAEQGIPPLDVAPSPALGFQVSFAVCAAMMSAGILVALAALPARPQAAEDRLNRG